MDFRATIHLYYISRDIASKPNIWYVRGLRSETRFISIWKFFVSLESWRSQSIYRTYLIDFETRPIPRLINITHACTCNDKGYYTGNAKPFRQGTYQPYNTKHSKIYPPFIKVLLHGWKTFQFHWRRIFVELNFWIPPRVQSFDLTQVRAMRNSHNFTDTTCTYNRGLSLGNHSSKPPQERATAGIN